MPDIPIGEVTASHNAQYDPGHFSRKLQCAAISWTSAWYVQLSALQQNTGITTWPSRQTSGGIVV
jgi:hypothetical protein